MLPLSTQTEGPIQTCPKAPGWWLLYEALWPESLRRGFCSWELSPPRLTKLQLQRGFYINVSKLNHYSSFPETSSFSGFLKQTTLFPPLSRKNPFPHSKATKNIPVLRQLHSTQGTHCYGSMSVCRARNAAALCT